MKSTSLLLLTSLTSILSITSHSHASDIEVLHFWTSAGEARALDEIRTAVTNKGHEWLDFAVTGGGGENARAILAQRVATGSPPIASHMKGTEIPQWAEARVLANLDNIARTDQWSTFLPSVILQHMTYDNHIVAVPVNIHRLNWMWVNLSILRAAEVDAIPSTLSELFIALDKVQQAGYVPLAHGSQPWQDTVLFESVILSVAGPEFYRQAFVELDANILMTAPTQEALRAFRKLKGYTDSRAFGRDWNLATAMLKQDKAAVQIMGDWAKGEFEANALDPGSDFACVPMPGTQGSFSYTIDSFAMFKVNSEALKEAQKDLVETLLDKDVQRRFNQIKGSIPIRQDMEPNAFDHCAQQSIRDFKEALNANKQVPSFATHMAMPLDKLSNVYEVISEFWNDDKLSVEQAQRLLAEAVK
ncbi:ABC transporter substrate-binding protein [Reinekea sp. G2M2-21]|uniref:ABC transporter substrate-binding protein n=1 Tax=Reinekea sp. G2M2-21 TaxID=2788942 RepID=UPI0018A89A1C|nr:ABC transporter substrate-binding protein [Reinekea sp. G2M2-21]